MRRILVVDDEVMIAQGVRDMLEEERDIEPELYCCYSGEEALKILDRVRIEIVVTDVKMPEMGGVALFEEIRRRWPQCRVIFLTGHEDFEPLYQVSRHKDIYYLLKSEGPERVVETVRKVAQELEDLHTEELGVDSTERAMGVFQAGLLHEVLQGNYSKEKLVELQIEISLDFDKPFFLLLGSSAESILSHADFLKGFFGLTELSRRHLSNFCSFELLYTKEMELIWILQSLEPERFVIHLPAALEMLQIQSKELVGFVPQLLFYSEAIDLQGSAAQLPRLMEQLKSLGILGGRLRVLEEIPEKIYSVPKNKKRETRRLFIKIDQYIEENLSGELSLTNISQLVHFNPTYLSKMFKDSFGISLSEHISERRLIKAKYLLINTDFKVQQICEITGNYSLSNFCRFFRSATGVSPQEYRRQGVNTQ